MNNDELIQRLTGKAYELCDLVSEQSKFVEPGSIIWLLTQRDRMISSQSVNIKVGTHFQKWFHYLVGLSDHELGDCGLTEDILGQNTDVDLIFSKNNDIYYMEMKANVGLDTGKLPATVNHVERVDYYLRRENPDKEVHSGILHWSVYNATKFARNRYPHYSSWSVAGVEPYDGTNVGLKMYHPQDLFNILNLSVSERQWYEMWLLVGQRLGLVENNT